MGRPAIDFGIAQGGRQKRAVRVTCSFCSAKRLAFCRDYALLLNDSAEHFGQRSLPLNIMGLNPLNLCPFTHLYFFLNHSSFMIFPLVH
jgi:hypothetical protein